jgi:hypothetical protein
VKSWRNILSYQIEKEWVEGARVRRIMGIGPGSGKPVMVQYTPDIPLGSEGIIESYDRGLSSIDPPEPIWNVRICGATVAMYQRDLELI